MKTTKALADAVKSTKATVFATISGVAYYKPNDTVYTEESKCEPYDFLSSRISVFIRNIRYLYLQINYSYFHQDLLTIGRKRQNYQKIVILDK